jgi:hypothetical protein
MFIHFLPFAPVSQCSVNLAYTVHCTRSSQHSTALLMCCAATSQCSASLILQCPNTPQCSANPLPPYRMSSLCSLWPVLSPKPPHHKLSIIPHDPSKLLSTRIILFSFLRTKHIGGLLYCIKKNSNVPMLSFAS